MSQAFYTQELHFRQAMRYPPFSALANILLRSEKQEEALRMSSEIAHLLTRRRKTSRSSDRLKPRYLDLRTNFDTNSDQSQGPSRVEHDSSRAEIVRCATQVERDGARH